MTPLFFGQGKSKAAFQVRNVSTKVVRELLLLSHCSDYSLPVKQWVCFLSNFPVCEINAFLFPAFGIILCKYFNILAFISLFS